MLIPVLAYLLLAGNLAAAELVVGEPDVLAEIRNAERSIDAHFKEISGPDPMGLTSFTRGGYLEGFGAVFHLEVMLVPVPNVSPFRPKYTEEEKKQLNLRKQKRLEGLDAKAREILVEEGSRLASVPAGEKVALIVSLFHFAWEDRTDLPSQLVVQATRQSLLDRQASRINMQEFRQSLDVRYF